MDRGGQGWKWEEVRKNPTGKSAKWVVNMGEPNLACHPVGAVLSKAQGRRDSAYNFVHLLIMDPTAVKNIQVFSRVLVQP